MLKSDSEASIPGTSAGSDEDIIRRTYEMFMPIGPDVFSEIMSRVTIVSLSKGDLWLQQGKTSSHVGVVLDGLLRARIDFDGREETFGFFYAPHFVTEYSGFVRQAPARNSIEVLEDCRIAQWTYHDIQSLYALDAKAERLGRLIAEQVFVGFMDRTMELLLNTPEERYRRMMERSPLLLQRVPLYMVASYLGITPESLSRIRSRIAKRPS
jgi:CRP-like cAMP-binding protein